jgi:SAM-dependent methyltransferase
MEVIACPVCGCKEYHKVYEGPVVRGQVDLTCAICSHCTHLYLNPRPSLEAYAKFYNEDDYGRVALAVKKKSYSERSSIHDEEFFQERTAHGTRLYETYLKGILTENDTVFDFGAGDGAWLYGLRKATGCTIDGNEPMALQVEFIRKRLGIDIFHAPIEELGPLVMKKYRGKVRLAIVSGSLQHMVDPMKCLEIARDILSDNGYLYVCNWDILYRMSRPASAGLLFKDAVSIDHVHYFHENSYKLMVQRAGFEILNFEPFSTIRYKPKHMEIFAKKSSTPEDLVPEIGCDQVLARIVDLEASVKRYRTFSLHYRLHRTKRIATDLVKAMSRR